MVNKYSSSDLGAGIVFVKVYMVLACVKYVNKLESCSPENIHFHSLCVKYLFINTSSHGNSHSYTLPVEPET
jgi:hypothetical protein